MAVRVIAPPQVAEMLGLEGSYGFPERLLQKIWLRGDFAAEALQTVEGRPLRVRHPGRWNLLGGPDFLGAVVEWGGPDGGVARGDIEVHLHASDWDAHGHATDPAYAAVILHVVLYPPAPGRGTRGAGGRPIPVLALLSWLHRGLEEFAADEAVERLARRPAPGLPEELGRLPAGQREARLEAGAEARWRQKVTYARRRVDALGWTEACHVTALEILGYRRNRAPFVRIAGRWPLACWEAGQVEVAVVFAAEAGAWSLQGVRPANHPLRRLEQYAGWSRARPGWPERLRAWGGGLPPVDPRLTVAAARRSAEFGSVRGRLATEVTAGAVRGRRAATLACDGWLPLLAAAGHEAAAGWWRLWEPGDLPPGLWAGLREAGYGLTRDRPAANGVAQGLLHWLLAREPTR